MDNKIKKSPREFATELLDIMGGTQMQLANLLGVSQSNVSRWINNDESDTLDPVRVLVHRLLLEASVRHEAIRAWVMTAVAPGETFRIVRTVHSRIDGKAKFVGRTIESYEPLKEEDGGLAAQASAIASFFVAEFLDAVFLANGDTLVFIDRDADTKIERETSMYFDKQTELKMAFAVGRFSKIGG